MKTLIAAGLAALLLSVSAASAQPFNGYGHGPQGRHDFARHVPNHHWVRGERFMPSYGRYVVVNDWRAFRLHRPPMGFYWVRVDGDFLLIGGRNGMIADIVFGRYY